MFKNKASRPYTENLAGLVTVLVALKLCFKIGILGNSLGPSLLMWGTIYTLMPLNHIFRSIYSC